MAGFGDKNAAWRIPKCPKPQQQLRDDQFVSHQLPNNPLGTKASMQDESGRVAV
jgi:hypothetical protein